MASKSDKYHKKVVEFEGSELTLWSLDGATWSTRKEELTEIKERREVSKVTFEQIRSGSTAKKKKKIDEKAEKPSEAPPAAAAPAKSASAKKSSKPPAKKSPAKGKGTAKTKAQATPKRRASSSPKKAKTSSSTKKKSKNRAA